MERRLDPAAAMRAGYYQRGNQDAQAQPDHQRAAHPDHHSGRFVADQNDGGFHAWRYTRAASRPNHPVISR